MSKKKIILKVNQSSFLDWFYSDLDSDGLRDIAYDVIDSLREKGKFEETVESKFYNDCGYFPFSIVDFPSEEIEDMFMESEDFADEEFFDTEGEINGRAYELKLIKNK
jgi:hypothetical protein